MSLLIHKAQFLPPMCMSANSSFRWLRLLRSGHSARIPRAQRFEVGYRRRKVDRSRDAGVVLPRPVVGVLTNHDDRNAARNGNSGLDKRAAKMIAWGRVNQHNISVPNVLFVLQPELRCVLGSVRRSKCAVLEPAGVGLKVRVVCAQLAPHRRVLEFGCRVDPNHVGFFLRAAIGAAFLLRLTARALQISW